MKREVIAQYSDGCFCDRPKLQSSVFDDSRGFKFGTWAKHVAHQNGIIYMGENKRSSGRSGFGILPVSCAHRQQQSIRFEWHICYTEEVAS